MHLLTTFDKKGAFVYLTVLKNIKFLKDIFLFRIILWEFKLLEVWIFSMLDFFFMDLNILQFLFINFDKKNFYQLFFLINLLLL